MTDEPRDESVEENGEEHAGDDDAPDAPPPRTWAGRAAAGGQPGEGEPETESEGGLTEEFEGLEAELSADLEDLGTDEHEAGEPSEEAEEEADEEGEDEAELAEPADESEEQAEEAEEAEEAAADPADEQEEPPDEFAFDPEVTRQDTQEVDTLAIAEREAKQEAAHAGLRARAEKAAAGRTTSTGAQASVAGAVAAVPAGGAGEPPKRNVGWRFFAAAFVVVASIAAATSIAFLLYLTDIGEDLRGDDRFAAAVERDLSDVEGGAPQTILILGSDQRGSETGDPGRSDTTMLLRVDPDKEFLALLSLPRDLQVTIPGYGSDKLNAAYSYGEQFEADRGGGPQLTLRTVKQLLGIDINHIVNVDFEGFYDAINAIGCVYIDVDRHYYNPQGGEYDDIDIEAGYTKLCGYRALDYVRYRHNDNDLVRGARQQSFVREARQQIPPRSLLPPPLGDAKLIDIFTKYTTSDINDAPTIVGMLRSFVDVRNAPVRQVSLGELSDNATGVSASGEDVKVAVDQFLGNDLDEPADEAPADEPEPGSEGDGKKKDKKEEPASGPAVIDVTGPAQEYAVRFQARLRRQKAGLPVFYPTAAISNPAAAISPESRMHTIEHPDGPDKKSYWGYKFVIPFQESFGLSYYGLAGTNWTDPPILKNPSETREIDGRDYLLYYEKDRLRLVGWTTNDGAYWISNTLTRTLSEEEMLAVATSTREVED